MKVTTAYLERLIRDYQAAYERANGKPAPTIIWEKGWFRFSPWPGRYRRAAVEEMLECLRERPAYPIPPAHRVPGAE